MKISLRKHQGQVSSSRQIPLYDLASTLVGQDEGECKKLSKHYRASYFHSPGIFTAQCACRYPKLIGLSTVLSMLISRFRILPRACYYDNGCNMLRSVAIRTPWVEEQCLIVSYRSHYRSHKCDIVTDPDSYSWCKPHSTSSAESINQHWKFSKPHVRF